jgi:hypothetical protein
VRHAEWEIAGPAEVRLPIRGSFHPYCAVPHVDVKRLEEPAPQINPHLERPSTLDAVEYFLTSLFLQRYVTYCARHRRYAQTQGAPARRHPHNDGRRRLTLALAR